MEKRSSKSGKKPTPPNIAGLKLVACEPPSAPVPPLLTIDLFCGAGGITEGFREAGYTCLYANDCMPEAIERSSADSTVRSQGSQGCVLAVRELIL